MDPAHPFPFVSNLSLNLLVSLRYENDSEPLLARVKVPSSGGTPRFVRIGTSRTFVDLADVMAKIKQPTDPAAEPWPPMRAGDGL